LRKRWQGVTRLSPAALDGDRLESGVHTASGIEPVADKTLRMPNTPIVIPLAE
jgi:hypothetical protein